MADFELPQLTQKNTKENERTQLICSTFALSNSMLGLPGQAWPSLACPHLAEIIHIFTQVQYFHWCTSDLDPVCPTWQYSSAPTML
jgi:hypothetical protein